MSETAMELLELELKSKLICRFCLSQNDKLSNIYSRENRLKSSAPLPLQVMACVGIEVFTNDGMPSFVCDICRLTFEHCYRFKQMCKKADVVLRQYPLTGVWPAALDKPKIPEELLPKTPPPPKILNRIVVDKSPEKIILDSSQSSPKIASPAVTPAKTPITYRGKPKLLNKNSIKILNKEAQLTIEPMLSKPIVSRNIDGNVEISTEILSASETAELQEPDPIKTAEPIETNVFPCPHCERSFPLRQLLEIHAVNHNRERSYECSECQRGFFSKYDLSKHVLIHTGQRPYKCVVCDKSFTRSTLLHRHEKTHVDIPKFICVHCEKPFLSKEEMEKHAERHMKNRPFQCKICTKSFAFKQGLERHEIIHSKNQPYPCQYCDQSFSTPSKLSRHLTAHAGNRPFPCKLCPKSYLLSHHLTRHLRSHKEGSGSYKCYDCDKVFTSRDDLIYHSAVHATQNLICPLCKEAFTDLDKVTEHIKQHAEGEQYACEFCDLIFMTAEKLQSHSDTRHSDDLAAYEDHDANVANENDSAGIDGEIIEEFIIEEYNHNEDDTLVKEEIIYENEVTIESPKFSPISGKRRSSMGTDLDFLEEEVLNDSNISIDAPASKIIKLEAKIDQDAKVTPRTKKMTQTTLTSVLQQLPKSVTISKKINSSTIASGSGLRSATSTEKAKNIKSPSIEPVVRNLRTSSKSPGDTQKVAGNQKAGELHKQLPQKNASTLPAAAAQSTGNKQLVEMMIGDRRVKVQKITVTKAQAAAMAKEGRIEMKNGTMILKQDSGNKKKFIAKTSP